MALEDLKIAWTKQKPVGYSADELNSIYHIKQLHSITSLKTGLSWDLLLALLISVIFIAVLQILDFSASNFWSVCMAVFATQHVVFYQYQIHLLRKYSVFSQNIGLSLENVIGKIRLLLWFYRLWPAVLTMLLSSVYVILFKVEQPIWQMLLIGSLLAIGVAILSNIISAVLVRKQLIKLESLRSEFKRLATD